MSDYFIYSDELQHHGVKGQRWGVRRYQNKDGSLTPRGKKRLAKLDAEREKLVGKKSSSEGESKTTEQPKKRTLSSMSNDELKAINERLMLENNYITFSTRNKELKPAQLTRGQKVAKFFSDKIVKDVVAPAVTEVGKNVVKNILQNQANKLLENQKK